MTSNLPTASQVVFIGFRRLIGTSTDRFVKVLFFLLKKSACWL
jgi:hypothetical protein